MANWDIETFYRARSKRIDTTISFVGLPYLRQLITTCRLKPYGAFNKKDKKMRKLQRIWVDEFGNSLYFSHRMIDVTLNNVRLKKNTTISTDLFYARSMKDVIAMSQSVVASENYFLFYGIDEYFRAFTTDGKRVSPVLAGPYNLLMILPYINSREKYLNEWSIYRLPNREIETMILKESK